VLVHPKRVTEPHRDLLLWLHPVFGIRWAHCCGHCGRNGRSRWLPILEVDVSINKRIERETLTDLGSFIMEGALTIIMAFAGYALLPNYPSNTSFLSAEETAMAQWRLNRENDGVVDEVSESVFTGLKQALSDPKVVSRPSILTPFCGRFLT
jgi:hypothetical protein